MTAIPVITGAEVGHLLDWHRMTAALLDGHREAEPLIADMLVRRGDDVMLTRKGWIAGRGVAVKAVSVFPGNPARGLPSVQGLVALFDDATGAPEAVIEARLVTRWKTAADSVLGARLLARAGSERLLIVGAGVVAASLVEAYRAIFPGIRVAIWNRTADRARTLAESHGAEFAPDLEAAMARADIISSATMTAAPLIPGAWLRPGQHLDLIGAYTPQMRETDDEAMRRARVFVDCRETTLDHIGELMMPLASGALRRSDILGDFRDLAAGRAGRRGAEEITLFKNGGGAHLDLLASREILRVWREAGQGGARAAPGAGSAGGPAGAAGAGR
jgi:ornithine cyclodeaminase